ncbi:MAG: LysM peptidoglycan-binding domain-containing protein [Defluviitaleaceae bacterium]|nr:LysM peptidoglycan-binding domain-containing protein [Defluviitaleaceae bacterium]
MDTKENKIDVYDTLSKEATKSLMQSRLKKELSEEDLVTPVAEQITPAPIKETLENNEEDYIRPSSKRLAGQGLSLSEAEREARRRSLTTEEEIPFVPKRTSNSKNSKTAAPQRRTQTPARQGQKRPPQGGTRSRGAVDPFYKNTKRHPNKPKSTPPIVYVGAGILALFIGIFIFLLVNNSTLSSRNRELQEQLYSMQPEQLAELQNLVSYLNVENEELRELVQGLHAELDSLEGIGVASESEPLTDGVAVTGERIHVVQSGNTLAGISQYFFNSQSPTHINAIMEANNLTSYNLSLGQELIIPNISN